MKRDIKRALQSLEPDYRPSLNAPPLELPEILVERANSDPMFSIVGYDAKTILDLAKQVGVRETMISTN